METATMDRLRKALDRGDIELARSLATELAATVGSGSASICNITEQDWGPYASWQDSAPVCIRGKKPGEVYSLYVQGKVTAHIDIGDGKSIPVEISARDRAEDIVRMINGDVGPGAFFGVFLCEGEKPTEQELNEANRKLVTWYKALVQRADAHMQSPNGFREVNELHRRAAKHLGVVKPWLTEVQQLVSCPACGEKIPPGVAVCKSCHAILDSEKAESFGLIERTPPPVPKIPAKGRARA